VLPNPWVRVAGGPPVRLDDVIGYTAAIPAECPRPNAPARST
jgi:hypothetical protein